MQSSTEILTKSDCLKHKSNVNRNIPTINLFLNDMMEKLSVNPEPYLGVRHCISMRLAIASPVAWIMSALSTTWL